MGDSDTEIDDGDLEDHPLSPEIAKSPNKRSHSPQKATKSKPSKAAKKVRRVLDFNKPGVSNRGSPTADHLPTADHHPNQVKPSNRASSSKATKSKPSKAAKKVLKLDFNKPGVSNRGSPSNRESPSNRASSSKQGSSSKRLVAPIDVPSGENPFEFVRSSFERLLTPEKNRSPRQAKILDTSRNQSTQSQRDYRSDSDSSSLLNFHDSD